MCLDHSVREGLTRRRVLAGAAGVAAGAALLDTLPRRLALASAARPRAFDGTSAYSMAMHIHSSFSEQYGSMSGHLYQAAANAVDVLWWTDHDHRMDGLDYRDATHFTSFAEKGATGQGGAWNWTPMSSGSNTSFSGGGIVQSPCSPNDPVAGGALELACGAAAGSTAKYGYYANSAPAGFNYRDNLNGQSLMVDVLLTPGWSQGYLELAVSTSYHQPLGGEPAGQYSLSYQFVPGGTASQVANGLEGVVTVPVTSDWQTVTLTPSQDIAAMWPGVDPRDFALWELFLNAVSTGDQVQGYFDYLRFDRTMSGQALFGQQADMMAAMAPSFPSVTQQQALEVSLYYPHVNWFGANITLPSYGKTTSATMPQFVQHTLIPDIHAAGGLASYNHPFGTAEVGTYPQSKQASLLTQVAGTILPTAALGADIMEVGYPLRSGVTLTYHLALWDIMSRNAVFLTGTGVTDDHFGTNWYGLGNNWVTCAWAVSTAMADLLAAVAAGRVWTGSLSKFTGTLDLLVDGVVPMGGVDVSQVTTRSLTATATGMPAGSTLQVLQGAVDYAGSSALAANTKVVGSYPAASLAGGAAVQALSTTASSFVRTQVVTSSGAIVAVSNPVWLLTAAPPNGIPGPRQA